MTGYHHVTPLLCLSPSTTGLLCMHIEYLSQLELLSALCLNEINKSKKTRGGKKACILQTNVKSIMP